MRVKVLVPSVLRGDSNGESEINLVLADGAVIGDLLGQLDADWPRLARRIADEQGHIRRYVNVYVDGEDCRNLGGTAAPLRDGGQIQVIPSVAGG
jgi:molybdopterin converting factor small subunit